MSIETIIDAYLECGLWSTQLWHEDGESDGAMDGFFDIDQCANREDVEREIADFLIGAFTDIAEVIVWHVIRGHSVETALTSIGHDFLLTRDGHGCGFWDRGYGTLGQRLTDFCRPYGDSGFMPHDDDYFICEGSTP